MSRTEMQLRLFCGAAIRKENTVHSARIRYMVYCAAFLALAVLFSFLSISFGPALRVSLSPAVIIFAGIVLGPLAGAVVGATSDVLVLLIRPVPGAYFPGFTLTFALYGLLGGLLYRGRRGDRPGPWQIAGSTALIQAALSALLNTLWLTIMTQTPFAALLPTRLPVTVVGDALYTAILIVLVRFQSRLIPRPLTPAR